MKWYNISFDASWATCANFECRRQITLAGAKKRRKCPICKLDNRRILPKKNKQIYDDAVLQLIGMLRQLKD